MFTDRTVVSRVLCLLSLATLASCFGGPIKIKGSDAAVPGQQSDGSGEGGETGFGDGPGPVADSKIATDGLSSNGGASGTGDSGVGGSANDAIGPNAVVDAVADLPATADTAGVIDALSATGGAGGTGGTSGTGGAIGTDGGPGAVDVRPEAADAPAADTPPDSLVGGSGGTGGTTTSGGTTATGGNTGTGGTTGTGGGAGSCGSRDCTSDKDNDCNGTADDQEALCKTCILGNNQACSTGGLGICAPGSQTCQLAADHQSVGWGTCLQNVARRSRDCTSSNDNDCSGIADNQEALCKTCIVGNSQACSTGGSGICAAGSQTCQLAADHQSVGWGTCLQDVAKRSRDCTSSNDNDCNGQADNTESTFCQCPTGGSPRSCSTGLSGICAAGSQACVVSGDKSSSAWGNCTQVILQGTETCANPGTDDNCDGIVDNVPVASCNVGTGFGACANGGYTACSGFTQVCNPGVSGMGDATIWHTGPAPNGSWDWDCNGVVTKEFPDTAPPTPTCTGLDISVCSSQPRAYYALSPFACGDMGDIGSFYCSWMSAISACVNNSGQSSGYQQRCR